MTRLDLLKQELEVVKNLRCLNFCLRNEVILSYKREIEAIEKYGLINKEVKESE